MHYEGLAGMPRRYYDFSNWESFKMFGGLNEFISLVSMIVFAAQLLFVFNFFYSIWKGRKVTTANPWGQLHWNGQHQSVLVMETGLEKFRKYTGGLMIILKMVKTSSIRPHRLVPMKANTRTRIFI
jgi:heme/copper-type cytochrome/quinol oxidase subunit 1